MTELDKDLTFSFFVLLLEILRTLFYILSHRLLNGLHFLHIKIGKRD